MYKTVNNLYPLKPLETFNNSQIHQYQTRQFQHLHKTQTRTKLAQFNISSYGPKLWNILPPHIKSIPNLNTFKYKLKIDIHQYQ